MMNGYDKQEAMEFILKRIHAKDHPERKAEMRAVRRAICTDAPWTMLGEGRFFRRSGKKYKIIALLYRARLLLPVMDLWQRLKGKR